MYPWRNPLPRTLRDSYLAKLGCGPIAGPTVEGLFALHRAHTEQVSYEVIWIALGETNDLDPIAAVRRVVAGRGGYCYHLNGAFATLLHSLGYTVSCRIAGVQAHGTEPAVNGNHLALVVSDLPGRGNPGGEWMVDVGLADALHEPLPLVEGAYRQGPFKYTIRPSAVSYGAWRFDHDPGGFFAGMDIGDSEAAVADLDGVHRMLTTSPDSPYVRSVLVARRDEDGIDLLNGRTHIRRDGAGATVSDLTSAAAWLGTLTNVFGIGMSDIGPDRIDALWQRVNR